MLRKAFFSEGDNYNPVSGSPHAAISTMMGTSITFATSAVVSKRPRSQLLWSHPRLHRVCDRDRKTKASKFTLPRKNGRSTLRMTARESLLRTAPGDEEYYGSGGIIPEGAFTIFLQVKIQDGVTVTDAKAILAEYARKTCAEPRVLRCDILYEVSSRGIAKGRFYEIWISFEDSAAYAEHEKTPHAAKLRVWLENPAGGDSAVMLTKLSYSSSVLEPIRPAPAEWKSGIDYSVEDEDERNQRMSDVTMDLIRGNNPQLSDNLRKSLEVLISNVGLENVTVLVATATASSVKSMPSLTGICEEYAEDQEKSSSVVRTGVLVERNNPLRIVVMTVHDSKSDEGAFFDTDMAQDIVDDNGWTVKRYFSVFPDKVGWERPSELESLEEETEPLSFLGPIQEAPNSITQTEEHAASASNCRLVQGAGAFDKLKTLIREMTNKPTGDIKAMIICGWNASRVQPVLVQLQTVKGKDPGVISFKFGLSVESCHASTKLLKKGFEFLREYRPDVLIAYGGGAVLDMTKALGLLGNASTGDIDACVQKINQAATFDVSKIVVIVSSPAIPVVLLPTTIGPGAELMDLCVFKGTSESGVSRRLCVDFADAGNVSRQANDRIILSDSRLVGPRRLSGRNAAQGAVMLVCRGIETLLSMYEYKGNQAIEQAEQAIAGASETIMAAYREPRRSSGQSLDLLTYAQTKIGLAADCAGKIGLCSRLSLAIVDELVDEPEHFCFRTALIRVTAAVMTEICSWDDLDDAKQFSARMAKALFVQEPKAIAGKILARAEDINVRLLPEVGMVRRSIPAMSKRIVRSMLHEERLSPLEQRFADQEILERVLHSAMEQKYEL